MNIEKKLSEITHRHFPEINFNFDSWTKIFNQTSSNPSVFHLLSKVRYYVAYFAEQNAINLSMVLHENQKSVGIMPLMAHKNLNNEWILTSNGIEIVEPIFVKDLTNSSRKNIEKKIFDMIIDLSKELKISKCKFVNMEHFKVSDWYINLLENAEETFVTYHLLVDLSLSLEEIKSRFRKSYRHCVNQGFKKWKVEVHENISKEKFDEFRNLHKIVSKKTTRPIETWNIQYKEIDSRVSFMVSISDQDNCLVGAGLFNCSKTLGVYESGAYNRDLVDKPLAHPVQMKAIETLKKKGLNWYELGQKFLKVDKFSPTDKELSISHFKEGFATNIIARPHLLLNMINFY